MTPTELAAEIFASFGTQTQTIIDQLAAYDYAGATGNAYALLANINAGAATMRNAATVARRIPEPPPRDRGRASTSRRSPAWSITPRSGGGPGRSSRPPPTPPTRPVFESDTTYEEDVDEDGKAVATTKSKKK